MEIGVGPFFFKAAMRLYAATCVVLHAASSITSSAERLRNRTKRVAEEDRDQDQRCQDQDNETTSSVRDNQLYSPTNTCEAGGSSREGAAG
jgi:hypothetical protein